MKALKTLSLFYFKEAKPIVSDGIKILGFDFSNRLGLAAGMDKNADYIDSLSYLGFGFLELGTFTPRAQSGNIKPRLFRLRKEKSLINSMGFNNKGIEHAVLRIKNSQSNAFIGLSIGKNSDTPMEKSFEDYLFCLEKAYPVCDYIAVNISSPNTKNLRELQTKDYINKLLVSIKDLQLKLASKVGYTPILIKISPDMTRSDLKILSESVLNNKLDGIICTNTTSQHNHSSAKGGLSGKPLFLPSTSTLELVREFVGKDLPIIASGGVMDLDSFNEKMDKGADLVQIYTGFIYEGPSLVDKIINSKSKN